MRNQKSMQEVINENHERAYREYMKKYEKAQKKDTILGYFVIAFIVAITSVCILLIAKQNKEFVQTCTSKGYSVNYCMDHM